MAKLKKRSDGYYCAWYKGKQFLGKTVEEAERKRNDYRYECEHGIEQQEPITVFDFAEKWLPAAKAGVNRSTYNQYAGYIDKLTDSVGDKLISAVTPLDIKNVWKKFIGKSKSDIDKARFLYRALFNSAIENGYCKTSPMNTDTAKPHTGSKGTHRCMTEREISLVESVPHRMQPAAMFMLKAGLRRGEVLSLQKKDIHDGRIWVKEAVKFVNNRPVVGKTKNESSVRQVPLFDPLKPVYDDLEKYVLPSATGSLCSETAFRRAWESYLSDLAEYVNGVPKRWYHLTKEWKQSHPDEYRQYLSLKNSGKKKEANEYRLRGWQDVSFRPHDCRHTFVSKGRDAGVDIHVMMNWCGHSSEKMILEIYDHVSEDREQQMIDRMNGTIEKP